MFVLLACFAWLVGLLCACRVRRFYGLWRFPAKSFLLSFRFPLLSCFRPALLLCFVVCFLSCSLGLCGSLGVVVVCFSLSDGFRYKKKGRKGLSLASSLVLLWVSLFDCGFELKVFVRAQPVNIVTKFHIKILDAGAANCFAFAGVLTCVIVSLFFFSFHISFFCLVLTFFFPLGLCPWHNL